MRCVRLAFGALVSLFLLTEFVPAQEYDLTLSMDGSKEVPPVTTAGTAVESGSGYSGCYYDDATNKIFIRIQFSNLNGTTSAAHIHGPAVAGSNAGVLITLAGFPLGVQSGSYDSSFVLSATNEARLFSDSLYVNIHTNLHPAGEIRGQLISGALLPVEIASMNARVTGETVELDWTTLTETNNFGFSVERRGEGEMQFAELPESFVAGAGTTLEEQRYSWTDTSPLRGTSYYRLRQTDLNGDVTYSQEIKVVMKEVVSAIEELTQTPRRHALEQNFPNPFNPATTIQYALSARSRVILRVYSTLCEELETLVDATQDAGVGSVTWDATKAPSGVYICRLTVLDESGGNSYSLARKIVLLR